jgi:hypothetical protein
VNLKDLKSLEELDLGNTKVDDDSMTALAGLKNLRSLDLMDTKVGAPGLRRLNGLSKQLRLRIHLNAIDMPAVDGAVPITALVLTANSRIPGDFSDVPREVNDSVFRHLALYPMLEELELTKTNIDEANAKYLGMLTRLTKLDLSESQISDAVLRQLSALTELRELRLWYTEVECPGKEVPEATCRGIQDDDLKHLEGLSRLRELTIGSHALTDAALDHLRGLKELRKLDLRNTRVTAAGEQKLRTALPEVKFEGVE